MQVSGWSKPLELEARVCVHYKLQLTISRDGLILFYYSTCYRVSQLGLAMIFVKLLHSMIP